MVSCHVWNLSVRPSEKLKLEEGEVLLHISPPVLWLLPG